MEYITTPAAAELNAAQQMRALGYSDAVAVPGGPDGGIDVRSSRAVAQVKWRAGQVGRPEVQRLYGARAHEQHKEMWFFAASASRKLQFNTQIRRRCCCSFMITLATWRRSTVTPLRRSKRPRVYTALAQKFKEPQDA